MKYLNEHLFYGQFGHFLVILSFLCSLFSTIAFVLYKPNQPQTTIWKKIGNILFIAQAIFSVLIFAIVYFLCSQHYFEYEYVFKHASKELESKYLLACIWEGKEGSFLLWIIWHNVIGLFFIFRNREYSPTVISVINTAQFFMWLMLLGFYFGELRLGSSLFTLTRNEINIPFITENYLSKLEGKGLNVLLRNYWMVIHPPVLFLGFALTIIPFALAIWGLTNNKMKEWVSTALPYSVLATCVLGVGIMMGGKWAYESLSFGGYWAWDPVENASLVPWLILVSLMHTLVIAKSIGHSYKASYVFAWLAYFFIIFSTFLTKSGILGDMSVHSFTDPGVTTYWILVLTLVITLLAPFILFLRKQSTFPKEVREETMDSREFWMFIGSLLFFITALFIISKTSFIPIYNKIISQAENKKADQEEVEFAYNKIIIIVTIFVASITAFAQFLKYKSTKNSFYLKSILISIATALGLTLACYFIIPLQFTKHGEAFLIPLYLGLFAGWFCITANFLYITKHVGLRPKFFGSSLTHIGFGILILGIIISSANKKVLSDNKVTGLNLPVGIDPQTKKQDNPIENLTLIKDLPTQMGNYVVTYKTDSIGKEKDRRFYLLDVLEKKNNRKFFIKPDVYQMQDNSFTSNPDIINYWNKDIFTFLSFATKKDNNINKIDTGKYNPLLLKIGDSFFYSKGIVVLDTVEKAETNNNKFGLNLSDLALQAKLKVKPQNGVPTTLRPLLYVQDSLLFKIMDTAFSQNLIVRFDGVDADKKIKLSFRETEDAMDLIAIKSYEFPLIGLVWLGVWLMAIGMMISFLNRSAWMNKLSISLISILLLALGFVFFIASN